MKLVFVNGVLKQDPTDYRWMGDRLLFSFDLISSDKISVVDVGKHRREDFGFKGTKPIHRVIDPAQRVVPYL